MCCVKNNLIRIYIWNFYIILSVILSQILYRNPLSVIYHRNNNYFKTWRGKVENFTLNLYILNNFTYNMEQSLDLDKVHLELSKYIYIKLLSLVIGNVLKRFWRKIVIFRIFSVFHFHVLETTVYIKKNSKLAYQYFKIIKEFFINLRI